MGGDATAGSWKMIGHFKLLSTETERKLEIDQTKPWGE
jgi:hypothetical protein